MGEAVWLVVDWVCDDLEVGLLCMVGVLVVPDDFALKSTLPNFL